MQGQNESFSEMQIQSNVALCLRLHGEIWQYNIPQKELLSGEFAINRCGDTTIIGSVNFRDHVWIKSKDSCVAFEYVSRFFDPKTKEYGDFTGFRQLQICPDKNGNVDISDDFYFDAAQLSEDEVISFVANLDKIVANDNLFLEKVNGYGFADMLFYCAIAGNKKAETVFINLLNILHERNLKREYGGEPAQIYQNLKVIYENL